MFSSSYLCRLMSPYFSHTFQMWWNFQLDLLFWFLPRACPMIVCIASYRCSCLDTPKKWCSCLAMLPSLVNETETWSLHTFSCKLSKPKVICQGMSYYLQICHCSVFLSPQMLAAAGLIYHSHRIHSIHSSSLISAFQSSHHFRPSW